MKANAWGDHGPLGARRLAEGLLGEMGNRWRHTVGVAARAAELAVTVPAGDRDVLVAAAWLHDIGYAASVADSGFHPLDGARHLDRSGWPRRVSALVAHHSGARLVAGVQGLGEALDAYPQEDGPVADALTYADQTVDSTGRQVTPAQRLADVLRRHGADSANARVHHLRGPRLLAIAARVERRLSAI
ncbi:2',3'-cyclic-nucleotide 2'-phosphodiesterase [Saccharothrix sp. ALI-22-I]|uniref:HD domain-containing protein n=1 Tax=Saccharothrix sp. ALI-22-I TaxID=1933778 RepID=UPI00097C2CC1|nr:HD domain-containing protein [Saccharothrix sp. ALI-22-I]ONI80879.1 2',3'-cyclic-nucleotide 2'-phosphodiesterase [Saccharothrix sp. ALI-22-I]